jgi:WD40 repeat protein
MPSVVLAMLALITLTSIDATAQLSMTPVSIPGVGSHVDYATYPQLRVRFRATRSGQPATITAGDVFVLEVNRYVRIDSLIQVSPGVYTAHYSTSSFGEAETSSMYAISNGDVGTITVPLTGFTAIRGASVIMLDSTFRRVPYFIDYGDVAVGTEKLIKLNVKSMGSTKDARGVERNVRIDSIKTSSSNFRVVWKGTYGTKPPPTSIEPGGDYRLDLICTPQTTGAISDVLTVVYEGGSKFNVMVFANTPTYKPTPVLRVLSPNGGENVTPCQQIPIRWKGAIPGFYAHVEFSPDNGKTWNLIDSTTDSTIVWTVPNTYTSNARIRVYQKQGASGARWLRGERSPATNLTFSADGRYLAVSYESGLILEYDVVSGATLNTYVAEGAVAPSTKISRLTYIGSTRNIAAVLDRNAPQRDQLQVFNAGGATPIARADVDMPNVIEIGSSTTGERLIVVGAPSGRVRYYDAATLVEDQPIVLTAPSSAATFADGVLTIAQIDGDVVRYGVTTRAELSRYRTNLARNAGPAPYTVASTSTAGLVAIGGAANLGPGGSADPGKGNAPMEQRTLIYDTKQDALIRVAYREGLNTVGLTFNVSETFLTMGFEGQPQIRQYDIVNRQIAGPILGMPGHSNVLRDIEYGPDGSTLASCSSDQIDNVLLRRIISPEEDRSDTTFQIVPLDMQIREISVGRHYIGTQVDTIITATICNTGLVPAVFTYGTLFRNNWLTLVDPIENDTVMPGACLGLRFKAVPLDTGRLVDTLEIQACEARFRIPFYITSVDRSLTLSGDGTDFGEVCVGDTGRRTLALVRNDDPIPVVIDGITMRKGTQTQFRIRGVTPGATLAPGSTQQIELLFTPRRLGNDTDEVVITYAGQVSVTRRIRVFGYGAGADIAISHPTLAFIPEVTERTVTLGNRSANAVTLNAASLPAGAPFTVLTPLPVTIAPGDSIQLRVQYNGGVIRPNDRIDFAFVPCASSVGIRLAAYTGSAIVRAPRITADPRGSVAIVLRASLGENVTYNGLRSYEGAILVNPRLFIAQSIESPAGSAELLSQEIVNDQRLIRFRINGNYLRDTILATLTGPAGIAEIDSTIIAFDTTASGFGVSVGVRYESGVLRIAGPDPSRRVLHPAPFVRARVVPNPSVDRAVLEVQSDVVVDLDVMITTTQGDVVQQDRVVLPSAGTYQVDLATQSLGAGVYTVHLRSGTRTTTTRMVIVR